MTAAPFPLEGDSPFVAIAIGIAFGFVLERAGLGSSRRVAAQFCGRDFTVLKVMFTAIVTAALGAFWLSRFGLLELSAVYVPETFLLPQVIGGLVFGTGMVIAGLCPGTACASAATGRGDGVAVIAGILAGAVLTGVLFEPLRGLYAATSLGDVTLADVTGLEHGVVVLLVTIAAITAFSVVSRLERSA